jgi:hypothetical protein
MALSEYIGSSLDGPISAARRLTIATVVIAASAVGAIFYLLAAAALALEPVVGAIYARLIVAGIFVLLGIAAAFAPRLFRQESVIARAQAEADSLTREQKIAMIIEAALLGFSMSSSSRRQGASRRK